VKNKVKRIQIFLFIVALIILVVPSYQTRAYLAGAKVPSMDLSFVDPDQDDAYPDQQDQTKACVSSMILGGMLPGTTLFKQISQFCFLPSFSDQKNLILRC
jgi:hypothetical protein